MSSVLEGHFEILQQYKFNGLMNDMQIIRSTLARKAILATWARTNMNILHIKAQTVIHFPILWLNPSASCSYAIKDFHLFILKLFFPLTVFWSIFGRQNLKMGITSHNFTYEFNKIMFLSHYNLSRTPSCPFSVVFSGYKRAMTRIYITLLVLLVIGAIRIMWRLLTV